MYLLLLRRYIIHNLCYFTDISEPAYPSQVGFYPEKLNGGGSGAMNIILSAKFIYKATIVSWEMFRIKANDVGWVEVLRPVPSEPGESYRVIHRTFVQAVAQNGLQKIDVASGLLVEPGDVLAVRPTTTDQFVDNVYDSSRLDWPNNQCTPTQMPNIDGSPTDITLCTLVYRTYALRAILNYERCLLKEGCFIEMIVKIYLF